MKFQYLRFTLTKFQSPFVIYNVASSGKPIQRAKKRKRIEILQPGISVFYYTYIGSGTGRDLRPIPLNVTSTISLKIGMAGMIGLVLSCLTVHLRYVQYLHREVVDPFERGPMPVMAVWLYQVKQASPDGLHVHMFFQFVISYRYHLLSKTTKKPPVREVGLQKNCMTHPPVRAASSCTSFELFFS